MKTLISVIVPVHNTKQYLKAAIDSIIAQKDFLHEIIIINDGSIDGSGELLEKLYSGLDFIKIVHTENQRQGPARNLGTQLSKGNFLYYFDSDDVVRPNLFEEFNKQILNDPQLELFCFSAKPFLDGNYEIEKSTMEDLISTGPYYRNVNAVCSSGEEAFNLLSKEHFFSPLPYLYIFKKSIVQDNNIIFRPIRFEDEEFTHRLFLYSGKTQITNTVYCDRRIREGSTMQMNRCFDDLFGYIKTIETLQHLQKSNKLKHETKQNLTNKIFRLAEEIIKIKTVSNLELSGEQLRIYKSSLKSFMKSNFKLFCLYHTYPYEYKLRMFKQKIFG